jgi:hypothetical protein
MISVDKLREVKQVFYHQSCPDGTASAMICYDAFRLLHAKSPEMIPELKSVQYNTDFFENKLEPRPGQLFVDITPPRAKWELWKDVGVIVLDHHESVKEVTEGLGGVYATNDAHSGARLAYEQVLVPIADFLCLDLDPERDSHNIIRSDCNWALKTWDEFSRVAMIRDTWKDKDPDFEKATVQAYGLMTLGAGDVLDQMKALKLDMSLITRMGEKDLGKAKFMAESARRYVLPCPKLGRDMNVDFYNCTEKKYISDGCHHLLNHMGSDFAVSYFYKTENGETQMVVSLRTNDPIASTIAKKMKGGGHDKAAGFGVRNAHTTSLNDLVEIIRDQLAALQ